MDDWSKDLGAKYCRQWSASASANTRYIPWSEMYKRRTEELYDRLRNSMVYGNWIVKDETNNPLEPIGIEEII